jgi:hypothetical protein
MRRFDRYPIRSRLMENTGRSPSDPAQQLTQHDRADKAEDNHRPRLPQQGVDELVQVRVWHAKKSSSFSAPKPPALLPSQFLILPFPIPRPKPARRGEWNL